MIDDKQLDAFHAHLDQCMQCRNQPFNLCSKGSLLLQNTVRCPDHRNGGTTRCPRGGAELQIWQRKQWEH